MPSRLTIEIDPPGKAPVGIRIHYGMAIGMDPREDRSGHVAIEDHPDGTTHTGSTMSIDLMDTPNAPTTTREVRILLGHAIGALWHTMRIVGLESETFDTQEEALLLGDPAAKDLKEKAKDLPQVPWQMLHVIMGEEGERDMPVAESNMF